MSDASLKRWCDAGGIPCRRHGKARRFALPDLIAALRERDPAPPDLLDAGGVDACAARIAQQWIDGDSFAACFDTLLASSVASRDIPALMSRLAVLADPPNLPLRPPSAVLGPGAGAREAGALSMAAVVLHARGFQPLVTPAGAGAEQLAAIALRASASVIVLATPLPGAEQLVETPILLLTPEAGRFVELDARLRSLIEDYQTRTRSPGAR